MEAIAEYKGNLLNHVQAVYRPGERELAIELAELLGCAVTDTGFASEAGTTFLAIHPNRDDQNPGNNVFYIAQMTPEQQVVEERLRRFSADDGDFRASLDRYRTKARTRPFGIPHFALRYRSEDDVEQVVARIGRSLAPRLGGRLNLQIIRPGDAGAAGGDVIQGFVHQDVFVSGSVLLGQVIELQAQTGR